MPGSWTADEDWYCESSGGIIDEGATSVAVEGSGFQGSYREVEAWLIKRAQERLMVKLQSILNRRPPHFGDASIKG